MCTFVCVKQVNWAQEIIKEPRSDRAGPNILMLILAPPPSQRQYVYFGTRKASKVGAAREAPRERVGVGGANGVAV
jgi:hypothetical protein